MLKSQNLLLLCYYDVLSIRNVLSMINQVLVHSFSVVNQEISFKVRTTGWFASPSLPGCAVAFPTIFIIYLNDLPI